MHHKFSNLTYIITKHSLAAPVTQTICQLQLSKFQCNFKIVRRDREALCTFMLWWKWRIINCYNFIASFTDSEAKLTSVSQFITVTLKCLECLGHDLWFIVNIPREDVCLLKPVLFSRTECMMHALSKRHLHMQKDVKAKIFGNKCELIVF